uniref:Scaffold protein involved in DNA repair n=1 Tax=Sphenodon punctatus TaxID=8508 RepID=A0A8D0GK81_SPHPU
MVGVWGSRGSLQVSGSRHGCPFCRGGQPGPHGALWIFKECSIRGHGWPVRGSRERALRKRDWTSEHTSFPDERPLALRKDCIGTAVAAASISEAWHRCGDGFQSISTWEVKLLLASIYIAPAMYRMLYKTISVEISEYSSDSADLEEGQVDIKSTKFGLTKKLQLSIGEELEQDTGRLASDWLKSAQVLLQTPKKQTDTTSKTPEDSAKKRKLLRGGLAERLNRLQNRQRSAISFWRHQCASEDKTLTGGKTGVLVVKILEVHEECTVHVAMCQQLGQGCAESSSKDDVADTEPRLKVLFMKETAAHLKGGPQDIIHIHPPWQKIVLPNESVPVIINTYFSQKILKKPMEMKDRTLCPGTLLIRRNIVSLAWTFVLPDLRVSLPQESAVTCTNMITSKTAQTDSNYDSILHPGALTALSDSLLEVVESQGAAGWRGVQVQVVVQRVYYLPARELHGGKQGAQSSHKTFPPPLGLSLLVQDAYGIFSEVQLQTACSSAEHIEQYSRRWEGKSCRLTGMKILQRTTRGRALGLFSLIDSLWPPLKPLKVPGQSQESEKIKANLPPPSFCYILTAQPEQKPIEVEEEKQISNLYLPPVVRSLKEILQICGLNQCCSFWTRIVYQRVQHRSPLNQREFRLFVTDFSLQSKTEGRPGTAKTLLVSVASSCILNREVIEALTSASPTAVFFKDALQENGRIICVERTILSLQKPLLYRPDAADLSELTGPVKLDELDSTTQASSICTVRGTVAGVNESTDFSWPTCNRCGNGKLEQYLQGSQCSQAVISPVLKMQLEVFLHCHSWPQCTVKVKLLHKTISSLLTSSSWEDGSYEVKSALGKEVGLLNCYVQSVTKHPLNCVGLEEIDLLEA